MGKHSIWLHNVNNSFEDGDLCVYWTYLDTHFKRILKCYPNETMAALTLPASVAQRLSGGISVYWQYSSKMWPFCEGVLASIIYLFVFFFP